MNDPELDVECTSIHFPAAWMDVETVDGHGWTMLHCAAFHGRLGCVQVLLRWGLRIEDVDKSGNTAVHLAAMEGHLPVLQCLIIQHQTPLLLLDTPNDLGETPESLAKRFLKEDVSGYIETVKKEHGLRPVDEVRFFATAFPAHSAAYDGDLTTLRTLIEEGVIKVNERDEQGSTPLHKAAGQGHVKIIHWLLENGADPSITNHLGERPVDVARRFGQSAAIEPLKVRNSNSMISEKMPGFLEGEPEPEVIFDKETALDRARRRIDKFQRLLDLAKSDYKQLGGEPEPEELRIQCEIRENENELESCKVGLEYERLRREKLEALLDESRREITKLNAKLSAYSSEQKPTEIGSAKESDKRKQKSKCQTRVKRRSVSSESSFRDSDQNILRAKRMN
ncbi:hypothetical protein CRM22_000760 [Opisthorchis felineus]|uniref:Uncharacterized protein n=1 Tax=Opisthorchis felineus TaxID=147828 RepID=A0A4S2MKF9_OPIFE|nr:hypothetical protein CRM22_000760 [Opisthorchis felineus]